MLIGSQLLGFSRGGCVLDTLSSGVPAGAFGLRRLTASYNGKCINVRRSSDNSAIDIGFVGNSLDVVTLLNFVGSGSGYITTWYNQGSLGSAGNMTQYSAAFDPRIVLNGTLATLNGRPALDFSENTTSFLNKPQALSPAGMTGAAFNFVGTFQPNGAGVIIPYQVGATTGAGSLFINFSPNSGSPTVTVVNYGVVGTPTTGVSTGTPTIWTAAGDTSLRLYVNGTLGASSSSAITYNAATSAARIGQNFGSSYWQGLMSELVQTITTLADSDRHIIEHNQEAYYGISGI